MDRSLFRALTFIASFQCLAQTPEPFEVRRAEPVFEELPELKASEILKPELLKGPHYVVRDPVPTSAGMNQFTIDSDFGVFEADGNEMLLQRLKEIDTIGGIMLPGRQAQPVSPMPYKSLPGNLVKARMSLSLFPEKSPRGCAKSWRSAV
jgi:hypothetical protein